MEGSVTSLHDVSVSVVHGMVYMSAIRCFVEYAALLLDLKPRAVLCSGQSECVDGVAHDVLSSPSGRGAWNALTRVVKGIGPQVIDMIDPPPLWMDDAISRAHLAGMAEHLATRFCLPCPEWCEGPEFFLRQPVILGGRHSRDMLISETPAAWRRRLLFCGLSPL